MSCSIKEPSGTKFSCLTITSSFVGIVTSIGPSSLWLSARGEVGTPALPHNLISPISSTSFVSCRWNNPPKRTLQVVYGVQVLDLYLLTGPLSEVWTLPYSYVNSKTVSPETDDKPRSKWHLNKQPNYVGPASNDLRAYPCLSRSKRLYVRIYTTLQPDYAFDAARLDVARPSPIPITTTGLDHAIALTIL